MSLKKITDVGNARKKAKKGGWGLKKVTGSVYEPVRLKKKSPTKTKRKAKRKTATKKRTQTKRKSSKRKTSRK